MGLPPLGQAYISPFDKFLCRASSGWRTPLPLTQPEPQLLPRLPYRRGFSYHPIQIFGILTPVKLRNYGTRLSLIEEAQPGLSFAKPYFGNILGKAPLDAVFIENGQGGINK